MGLRGGDFSTAKSSESLPLESRPVESQWVLCPTALVLLQPFTRNKVEDQRAMETQIERLRMSESEPSSFARFAPSKQTTRRAAKPGPGNAAAGFVFSEALEEPCAGGGQAQGAFCRSKRCSPQPIKSTSQPTSQPTNHTDLKFWR